MPGVPPGGVLDAVTDWDFVEPGLLSVITQLLLQTNWPKEKKSHNQVSTKHEVKLFAQIGKDQQTFLQRGVSQRVHGSDSRYLLSSGQEQI